MHVDPDNAALQARVAEVARLRAEAKPTVPMSLLVEKATNPFLRAPALKASMGMESAADWEAFGEVRRRKDVFKG